MSREQDLGGSFELSTAIHTDTLTIDATSNTLDEIALLQSNEN